MEYEISMEFRISDINYLRRSKRNSRGTETVTGVIREINQWT